MSKRVTNNILATLLFIISIFFGYSQTDTQAKKIVKNYNSDKLKTLQTKFETKFNSNYKRTIGIANKKAWPIRYKDSTASYRLKELLKGRPIYWTTNNVDAAISTRTNYLHNDGGLGFNLEGQNMTAYIWEVDGIPLLEHNEYDGIGGNNRVVVGDNETLTDEHSAHVTGTIVASGFDFNAKGMAPQANAVVYNVVNDLGEAAIAASNGMLLSNHSYGVPPENLTGDLSYIIGAYIFDSRDWDELMFNAPYYLQVIAAGNSGNDNTSNSEPLGGNSSYDKLTYNTTSKNNLVVANGEDASINANGDLISVIRNSNSSEGPTDDLRIKPDIMGNGSDVYSSIETSPSAYGIFSGTSMASPNVCGSLLLLQQHYNNLNNNYMKAATLKGLALHTADDVNTPGPDAATGWGLLNAKTAVETITDNGFSSWISEEVLTNGNTFSIDVVSDGLSPLLASISWTDLPGEAISIDAPANQGTPVLVNDLDIRITQNTEIYTPWKLTAVDANTQGDNTVDPYERVDVIGASGTYTITITHKGNLIGGPQNFSLIVTGLSTNFNFNTTQSLQTICSNNDAVFNFDYIQTLQTTTNFSLINVPENATTTILPNALSLNGNFEVSFGNLSEVTPGKYTVSVIGSDGTETKTRNIELNVFHQDFTAYPISLDYPENGAKTLPNTTTLKWNKNLNAENYLIEVSNSPSFNTIEFSNTVTDTLFNLSNLVNKRIYYWRVKPINQCAEGNYSETYSFQVGSIECGNHVFTATDFSDGEILTVPNDTASAPVTVVTGGLTINSIETSFKINHTWVNDLSIALQGPESIGSPVVLLFSTSCITDTGGFTEFPGDGEDFDVTFSDNGSALFCNDEAIPSITGNVLPIESLLSLSGLQTDGVWSLLVLDPYNEDGGNITAFSVDICVVNTIIDLLNFTNNGFEAPLNAIYTFQSSDIEAITTNQTTSEQVYTLITMPNNGTLEKTAIPMAIGDTFTQDDINTGKISYTNTNLNPFDDHFTVDVTNSTGGWLPNQTINLNNALSQDELRFNNLSIWPNPTKNNIHIKLDKLASNNDVSIDLYDLQGRLIYTHQFKVNNKSINQTIDFSAMQTGVYLLEVKQDAIKTTKRIIVR